MASVITTTATAAITTATTTSSLLLKILTYSIIFVLSSASLQFNSNAAAASNLNEPGSENRLNILLLGVDSNQKDVRFKGSRSDTNVLLSLNPDTKRAALISIPRDSRVFVKGHGFRKLNAAHAIGGAKLAVSTVQTNFGVTINHFAVVDTIALRKICELLGPMQVDVQKPLKYVDQTAHLNVNIPQGRQLLSPAQVEHYVRFRHDGQADIGRIHRQQNFLKLAFAKLHEPAVLLKLPQMINVACSSVRTDLSPAELINLAMTYQGTKPENVDYATLPGRPKNINHASYWILDQQKARVVLKGACGVT